MSKELYVTSTPHETKLAVVEDDQLVEVFFERENEYTLAGSIYKGKVTRVLPGMQSAFVEIGLERDAFLYVTDFLEEVEEDDEPVKLAPEGSGPERSERPERTDRSDRPERSGRGDRPERGGRDRGGRHRRSNRPHSQPSAAAPAEGNFTIEHDSTQGFGNQGFDEGSLDQPVLDRDSDNDLDAQPLDAAMPAEGSAEGQGLDADAQSRGPRRWRGRRGRRRGRSGVPESKFAQPEGAESAPIEASEHLPELPRPSDFAGEGEDGADSQSAMLGSHGESTQQMDTAELPPIAKRFDRPASGRTTEDRPREDRPREDREGRSREGRSRGSRPREGRSRDDRPRDDRPREDRPREDRPHVDERPRPQAITSQPMTSQLITSQPIILPGESLAKFGRKAGADKTGPEGSKAAGSSEARTQLPRPSSEYTAPVGLTAAGTLAGESLAKYRKRPQPPPAEPKAVVQGAAEREQVVAEASPEVGPEVSPEVHADVHTDVQPEQRKPERTRWEESQDSRREGRRPGRQPGRQPGHQEASVSPATPAPLTPEQVFVDEGESFGPSAPQPVSMETAAAEPLVEESVAEVPEAAVTQPEPAERVSGDSRFHPGQGVIEEEEIEEEEHDPAPFSEQLEEGEFEELEEETLEHREEDVIAAGDGLAEAFALSRVQGGAAPYMVEEEEDEDEDEDDEDDEAESEDSDEDDESEDSDEDELQVSSDVDLAEAEAYDAGEEDQPEDGIEGDPEGGAEGDPEDPNYAGRAELRGAAGTAGFQQRAERGSAPGRTRRDRDRGDRGRRGGRPMRRGGPRRNTPRGPMPQIGELLKEGQEILVQIAKEPMAKKGARITSHIALPGRYLVFMPTVSHTGVSRKIGSDEERQRLKRILLSEKGQSNGGFIVRTAASGASEEDLRADIRFLINLWNEIKQRAETSKAPALIYHDLNLVERILRDQVTANFSHIWVDTEAEYERILRFASRFQPALVKRVKLYTKDTPLFEQFNIQEEINKALKSKVWLKSGGYIVINQTEALVAIDINTGKYVGKTGRLEDTIVKTNLDAIREIVRQIRLRDLGGIIIIDFIDMDERKNRQKVMQALEAELKNDRSPSKVLQFNDFGLVAITRKRVKQSLERTLSTQCTYCVGTGMIKSVATACNEIYVEMRKMNRHLEGGQIMLRVNPEVAKALKENQSRWLAEMEELTGKSIIVKSDPAQHQEQFEIH